MQPINFYDEPPESARAPEDVRLKNLGLYVHEDGRRVAVGFDITPFQERPSLEVTLTNERGEVAGSLTVIEALQPNFHLTVHLRDAQPTERYHVEAVVYYGGGQEERSIVDRRSGSIDITRPGDQTVWAEEE